MNSSNITQNALLKTNLEHGEPSTSSTEIPLQNEYFGPPKKSMDSFESSSLQKQLSSDSGNATLGNYEAKEIMSFSVDSGNINRSSISFKNRCFDPSKAPFFPNLTVEMENEKDVNKQNNSIYKQQPLNQIEQGILSQNRFAATPVRQGLYFLIFNTEVYASYNVFLNEYIKKRFKIV